MHIACNLIFRQTVFNFEVVGSFLDVVIESLLKNLIQRLSSLKDSVES